MRSSRATRAAARIVRLISALARPTPRVYVPRGSTEQLIVELYSK
jgi:hypothetical protein